MIIASPGVRPPIRPKYHTFPGDQQFDYGAVWRVPSGYLAVSAHTYNFAIRCGLRDVSPQTKERWWRLWAAILMLDNLADDQPLERRPEAFKLFEQILRDPTLTAADLPPWMDPEVPDGVQLRQPHVREDILQVVALLRNSMEELGPTRWEKLVETGIEIRDLAQQKAETSTMGRYRALLIVEGYLTALLALICMSSHEEHKDRQYRRFCGAAALFCIITGILDHRVDLEDDFHAERTNVIPNRRHNLRMLWWQLQATFKLLRYPHNAFSAIVLGKRIVGRSERAIAEEQKLVLSLQ